MQPSVNPDVLADAPQVLAWCHKNATRMVALLRDLVEIESPSTEPDAVAVLASRLLREMDGLGLEIELVPVEGAGPVLRARAPGATGARPVMVLGHLDTVWPLGTINQRPVRIQGDLLFGPGSYDMKAGLVIGLFALRALRALGPLPAVTVFFTPLEEVDCDPYRPLMEEEMRACAAVLDFEPAWPGGAVKTERKGSGSFVMRAAGRSSHAGADLSRGANAIVELAHQTLALSALTDTTRGVSANVGVVRGGLRSNVVPDFAELEVDFRFRTLADGQQMESAIRGLLALNPEVALTCEGGVHYPPLERTPAVVQVFETARAIAESMGLNLLEVATGGASEASFAAALGVPTLDGLGGDGDHAHGEEEHVVLSSLPERAALAAGLIRSLAVPR